MTTTAEKISIWRRQGWYPVKFAHHPLQIKEEIRKIGMRPQMKQCYGNCQRFTLYTDLDVEYHEGWMMSIIPISHAWLVWRGRIIDLTLEPDDDRQYLKSSTYTVEQIRTNVIKTGCWCPVNEQALAEISPFYEHFIACGGYHGDVG